MIFGSKEIKVQNWTKIFFGYKKLAIQKEFGSKIIFGPKTVGSRNLGSKNLGPGPEIFFGSKNFWVQEVLGQTEFWIQKYSESQNILEPRNLSLKKYLSNICPGNVCPYQEYLNCY